MHLWTNHSSRVDELLYFQVGVGNDAARRANGCDSIREIQSREADSHVGIHRRRSSHREEHVVVHTDQTREYRVAREVHSLCAGWNLRACTRLDRLNLSVVDHDRLIVFCRSASAVDHANVSQRNELCFRAYELLTIRCLCESGECETEKQQNGEPGFHFVLLEVSRKRYHSVLLGVSVPLWLN